DDPRVIQAVREYLAALEAGKKPDRLPFLGRFSEIAGPLAECLDALEFMHAASPFPAEKGASAGAAAIGPEGVPLGDYRILREIGRGGMGVVYEAQQMSLGRRVALKMLPFASALDARQLQRFHNEAQAAAHLHHQNIVPVYAVGCERGVHYYAMQFIEGRTLKALVVELRQLAGLEPGEERGANGQSRRAGEPEPTGPCLPASEAGLTVTGELMGTLRYMSPEQAQAKRAVVDHRTDIYSLGVTLYELLTLQPAFDSSDRLDLLRQVIFEEPRPPRRINKAVPAD